MTEYSDVIKFLDEAFGLEVITETLDDCMLLKINGIDNNSLAKHIVKRLDGLKVLVREREGYKFGNNGWIKIQKHNNKKSILLELTKDVDTKVVA